MPRRPANATRANGDSATDVPSRRDEIFRTAVSLMRRRGYRGTTLKEIARALDVTEPALYYYFKTKEELLFAIYAETQQVALSTVRRIRDSDASPEEKLRAVIAEFTQLVAENEMFAIFFREKDELSPENWQSITRGEHEFVDAIRGIVEEGVRAKRFRPLDPTVVAFGILGIGAWVYRWFDPRGKRSLDEVIATYQTLLVEGLVLH
ncbi:MAG: hypothetical protein QOD51_2362 [Candidatus Eremiobacteraeota bacterium]|nr:hypothetical protein [Candidatus Eremiobacteraeota bacterium]